MNYMYGKGCADELEAKEIVRKISHMIEACEPDVRFLVRREFPKRDVVQDYRALQQRVMQETYAQQQGFLGTSGFRGSSSLSDALFGPWWTR